MRWTLWLVMVMSGSAVAGDAPLSPAVDGRLADASAVSDPTVWRIVEAAAPLGMPVAGGWWRGHSAPGGAGRVADWVPARRYDLF